jgi:hypothetical protein
MKEAEKTLIYALNLGDILPLILKIKSFLTKKQTFFN